MLSTMVFMINWNERGKCSSVENVSHVFMFSKTFENSKHTGILRIHTFWWFFANRNISCVVSINRKCLNLLITTLSGIFYQLRGNIRSPRSFLKLNPFWTNFPLTDNPGSWFLLLKCLKNTCGRGTFNWFLHKWNIGR